VKSGEVSLELLTQNHTIRGFCPYCGADSVFKLSNFKNSAHRYELEDEKYEFSLASLFFQYSCALEHGHNIFIWTKVNKGIIEKLGQDPSLATIALDESRRYRKVLSQEDTQEFHKAIGLAAHGVGIGSYVYLRRIFERLIQGRFRDHQADEGWNEEDFNKLRMVEKVGFLKNYLPDFLVENKDIYGILSQGIHTLTEQECLAYFEVLKLSVVEILEEDTRLREKRLRKEELTHALKGISPGENGNEKKGKKEQPENQKTN
jgi:hypothetical protein